jgi:hypothetical protein
LRLAAVQAGIWSIRKRHWAPNLLLLLLFELLELLFQRPAFMAEALCLSTCSIGGVFGSDVEAGAAFASVKILEFSVGERLKFTDGHLPRRHWFDARTSVGPEHHSLEVRSNTFSTMLSLDYS